MNKLNLNDLGASFIDLWENLAGIQINETSKIIRLVFFTALIIGSAWAVMNYTKSEQLSDLSSEIETRNRTHSRHDPNINRLIERVNSLNKVRDNGGILAGSMTAMNRRLFNTDSDIINGSDTQNINLADNMPLVMPEVSMPTQITPPDIQVKAVMTSGKSRLAIINTPNAAALIVKRGFKLPGDSGRITAINKDSITLNFADHNFIYSIGEAGATDTAQANNKNSSRKSLKDNMQSRWDIQDLYRTAK